MKRPIVFQRVFGIACGLCLLAVAATAQERTDQKDKKKQRPAKEARTKGKDGKKAESVLTFPPVLPRDLQVTTEKSDDFLLRAPSIRPDVTVARTAPTIDFLFYPGQTYEGKPWSNWGEGSFAAGKYYSAIGDHLAPQGNAFVYEYDPQAKSFRKLTDLREVLKLPEGHYVPGKIHSHVDMGRDGWLYFSTHRGSTRVTTDEYHYQGDWILRADPRTARSEIVVHAPVPKHCLPNGQLDSERLIFYGGTAPGQGGDGDDKGIHFFAYDVQGRKMLYSGPDGPSRAMILAQKSGRVYFTPGQSDSPLMRYDPAQGGEPIRVPGAIGLRAATNETASGIVYTVSYGRGGKNSALYALNTKTEQIDELGPAPVGENEYIASLAVDPSGRYVYYVPGAHGGSDRDGSPIVQFDTSTKAKKVIAFLHPYFEKRFGFIPKGTYSVAMDDRGESLFVTWNISRGSRAWDCCGLTVVHIPAGEREL
jgi:hypothetical protein